MMRDVLDVDKNKFWKFNLNLPIMQILVKPVLDALLVYAIKFYLCITRRKQNKEFENSARFMCGLSQFLIKHTRFND